MASWVYLPEQLRAHPALVGTELYAYRTGNRIILPPSEDVVRDIDTILDRLTCEDDEAWIYAHFLRFRVNEWVQKYGTYQGFGEHPIPSTNPANETVEQGTARSPVRAPEPRMSGADLEGHHEVYSKIGARVSKKKVRPRQPVPDKEFYAGTDMYLCKKRKKWFNIDPTADDAILRGFERVTDVDSSSGAERSGSSDDSGSSGTGSI